MQTKRTQIPIITSNNMELKTLYTHSLYKKPTLDYY